jgi:hypothetical protein
MTNKKNRTRFWSWYGIDITNKKIWIRILVRSISRLLIRYRYHDMIIKKIRTRFWSWYGIHMNKKIRTRFWSVFKKEPQNWYMYSDCFFGAKKYRYQSGSFLNQYIYFRIRYLDQMVKFTLPVKGFCGRCLVYPLIHLPGPRKEWGRWGGKGRDRR